MLMSCEIDYVQQENTKALAMNVSSAPTKRSTSRCQGAAFLSSSEDRRQGEKWVDRISVFWELGRVSIE